MARFSGKIGYIEHVETSPSVWTEKVTERQYYGDLTRNVRKWGSGDGVNDNITFNQTISVVADPYLYDHAEHLRYVIFRGTKWKIKDFEINRPRVIISIGEVYHGDEA